MAARSPEISERYEFVQRMAGISDSGP